MNASLPTTPEDLIGGTWHLLRGSKYAGVWTIESAELEGEWIHIRGGGAEWYTRLEDCFATEAAARAEGKARRAPRQAKRFVPLYGDVALLAAFHGIATDGSGRIVK